MCVWSSMRPNRGRGGMGKGVGVVGVYIVRSGIGRPRFRVSCAVEGVGVQGLQKLWSREMGEWGSGAVGM